MVVTREAKTLQWSDIGRRITLPAWENEHSAIGKDLGVPSTITRVEHGKKITIYREGRTPLLLEPDTKINVRGALSRGD